MAGFNFDSLKNKISGIIPGRKSEEDFDRDDAPVEEAEYEDGYVDEETDEEYVDDQEYSEEEYEDGEYSEEEYDDAEYEDEAEEGEYDDDVEYDDEEYDDAGEEEDDYNKAVFDKLYDGENEEYDDAEYDDEEYDDGEYDDGEYEDGEYEEEYEEEADGEYEDFEDENSGRKLPAWAEKAADACEGNDVLMYILLALLPPVGLFLLWYRRMYDGKKRLVMSAVAIICFILWLFVLFGGKGTSNDPTLPDDGNVFASHSPAVTATETVSTVTETAGLPTPTPHISDTTVPEHTDTVTENVPSNTDSGVTYVYATGSSKYYHLVENCDGMIGASKYTLDTAVSRGLLPCSICAGGVNTMADNTVATTYYCTPTGTWYHVDPTCKGMNGATATTEAYAISAGKIACPTCIGYYGTPNGKWYHSVSNCQKMQNAITKPKEEWEKLGKTACPTCMTGGAGATTTKTPTETMVYYTTKGTWFHTDSKCTGMKNATQGTISSAVKLGKTACPTCVVPSKLYVFATSGGKNYHTKADCTGMKNAQYVTAAKAMQYNKTACPTCATMLTSSSSSSSASAAPAGSTTMVYARTDGTYYHTDSKCSGMKNAVHVSYATAVAAGKKRCPTCVTPTSITVYARTDGKYYHTDASCSGMKNAVAVTAKKAIAYGKTACPTCAADLSTSSSSSSTANNGGNGAVLSTMVYATKNGTYYHTKADCTGMKDPSRVSYAVAVAAGKKRCPTCVTTSTLTVFATANGDYYHTVSDCTGMKNAVSGTAKQAIAMGKTACPTCAAGLMTSSSGGTTGGNTGNTGNTGNNGGAASATSIVYISTGANASSYYHKTAKCSAQKFSNGTNVTLEYAINHGYSACPSCNPPSKIYS